MDQSQNNQLLAELFDNQPQKVIWFKPIWSDDQQRITDFEVQFCNQAAMQYMHLRQNLRRNVRFSDLAQGLREEFLPHMVDVYETGTPSESDIYHPGEDKYVKVLRSRVHDGVLVVVQDRTQEQKLLQELERQRAYSESLLNASLNCMFSCQAVRDNTGAIIDMRYVSVNDKAEQLLQLPERKIVGHTMLELLPQTAENGLFDLCRRVIETRKPERAEIYYNSAFMRGWHDVAVAPLDGNGLMMTCADITQQKLTALETERQRALLDNILKHSPTGISVIQVIRDANGTVVDGKTIVTNEVAGRYFGLSTEQLRKRTFKEKHPTIFNSPIYQTAVSTLQTGEPFHTQLFFERTGKWLEFSVSKLDSDHLITVFMDITEAKNAQLQLEKSLEELRRSNANLEEFAHAASHDLKEPIRKIQTFSERLKSSLATHMNETETQIFARMENATLRMRLLVDDLLEYSIASHRPRHRERVDLNVKLQTVLSDLEVQIEEKKAKITVGHLPVIKGNKRQMQQLFQNLITNALKYSKPGVPPEISITARKVTGREVPIHLLSAEVDKTYHLIEVTDNGIGFEPQYAERIFHMFQRLHGKAEYPGTGVGLSIARKVVENHDGYIWARSEPNEGATFYVLLPVED